MSYFVDDSPTQMQLCDFSNGEGEYMQSLKDTPGLP